MKQNLLASLICLPLALCVLLGKFYYTLSEKLINVIEGQNLYLCALLVSWFINNIDSVVCIAFNDRIIMILAACCGIRVL
jgi:hypothetical protein